jgi:DNA invertase Pin-like site-specific DNA recombinase
MLDWAATREVKVMHKKRYTSEEVIQHLRTVELETGKGLAVLDACRKLGVTEQTYYRWKNEYGGVRVDQAKWLKGLVQENARLKRLVADLSLDNSILKEVAAGNF